MDYVKKCPQCGVAASLSASECASCGHAYRQTFLASGRSLGERPVDNTRAFRHGGVDDVQRTTVITAAKRVQPAGNRALVVGLLRVGGVLGAFFAIGSLFTYSYNSGVNHEREKIIGQFRSYGADVNRRRAAGLEPVDFVSDIGVFPPPPPESSFAFDGDTRGRPVVYGAPNEHAQITPEPPAPEPTATGAGQGSVSKPGYTTNGMPGY